MYFKNRLDLLWKFFLSYLLILSIPITILGFVMYKNTVVSLQNEVEESNLNKLEQVNEMLELQIQGFSQTAAKISINPDLTPYMVKAGGQNAKEAIEELQMYKDNNTFASEVLLYFRGDDMIYSSAGTSTVDALTRYIYKFPDSSKKLFIDDLNNSKTMVVKPVKNLNSIKSGEQNLLTYMIPIPNYNPNPYGTVLFMIRESILTDRIENILGDFKGSVYILDADNQVLASKNKDSFLSSNEVTEILGSDYGNGIDTINVGKEQFSIIHVRSDATGWSYIVSIPTDQFLKKVLEMKSFVILLFSIVIILGVGLSWFLSFSNYRPIRSLVEFVKPSWKEADAYGRRNEYDIIQQSVSATMEQIDAQKPYVKEQFFINLLKGKFKNKQEIDDFVNSQGILFNGTDFFVIAVSFEGEASDECREHIMKQFGSFSFQDWMVYGVELIEEDKIALIVNAPGNKKDFLQMQKQLMEKILSKLKGINQMTSLLGVGKMYKDKQKIHRSFIEATAALEHKFKTGRSGIIFFDEIKENQENPTWYPFEEQLTFVQSLKRADQDMAIQTMNAMLNSIAEKDQSILLMKCMCFDIINTILKTINEMNIQQYTKNVKELLNFQTLDELKNDLTILISEICEHVDTTKESKNSEKMNEILDYIHENYRSYELSLEHLADRFKLSSSYLSRYMKDQLGYTFTEYLMSLRLEEVKKELRTSDKTIKEIINNVGYLDVSNFMKRFKKIEGVTPGEYRKMHS
jgi:two-component system response regulator YesN